MKLDFVIALAAAATSAPGPMVRMPSLEALLARGDPFVPPAGACDSCLIAMCGFDPAAVVANAALYAIGEGLPAADGYWLRADPVNLQPTTAQLTLSELPEHELTAAEAQALGTTLAAYFATDDHVLFTPHPQRWYLRTQNALDLETLPPAACAGTLHESALPSGRDSAQWKRVITEAQMLLHSHPVNAAREAEGKAPANAIWPWGGGRVPSGSHSPRYDLVFADDLLARGLARTTGVPVQALPSGTEALLANADAFDDALVVLRSPAIEALDREWISALKTALVTGQVTELSLLVCGGHGAIARRTTRAHLRRWWRRRRALANYG